MTDLENYEQLGEKGYDQMFTDFAVTTNKERCCSSWHADKLLDSPRGCCGH